MPQSYNNFRNYRVKIPKIFTKAMKQYVKNLWVALLGRNPYEMELSELQRKYEKATENVSGLQELYCNCVETYDAFRKKVAELEGAVKQSKVREESLQQLVENLRLRLADKEHEIALFRKHLEGFRAQHDDTEENKIL